MECSSLCSRVLLLLLFALYRDQLVGCAELGVQQGKFTSTSATNLASEEVALIFRARTQTSMALSVTLTLLVLLLISVSSTRIPQDQAPAPDGDVVLVYGATPAGMAAALAIADLDRR